MTKTKQTLTAIVLGFAAVTAVNAAPHVNAEIGPSQFDRSVSRDRAEVVAELKAARAAGEIVTGEKYPVSKQITATVRSRAEVVSEVLQSAKVRAKDASTGANGYLPG